MGGCRHDRGRVLALAGCGGGNSSNNAYLSTLTLSVGATLFPDFDPDTTAYTVRISNAAAGISFTPTAQDSGADITIDDLAVTSGTESATTSLSTGTTEIVILVTAENGSTTKTYTVTVELVLDGFDRADTTGLDLGTDWTVYGTGTDAMYIDSGWVNSVYNDAGNGAGVYAEYNGTVSYSGGLYASAMVNLDGTAPMSGDPDVIGGIMINCDPGTWSGYLCQIEWSGSAYQLVLVEYDGLTAVNTSVQTISPAFAVDTTYLLEIDSYGTDFAASLKSYDGTDTYAAVTLTDSPRTYTDGSVVYYNYVTNSGVPTGDILYWDEFTIEQY